MDPFTSALIIGGGFAFGPMGGAVAAAGVGIFSSLEAAKNQEREQKRLAAEQEKARQDQVRAEVGAAQQRTNTALTSAATRKVNAPAPSFAGSVLGGLPSLNQAPQGYTSSGTF